MFDKFIAIGTNMDCENVIVKYTRRIDNGVYIVRSGEVDIIVSKEYYDASLPDTKQNRKLLKRKL